MMTDRDGCPICEAADQTQPVSSVVDSQTLQTAGYGTIAGFAYTGTTVVPAVFRHQTSGYSSTPLAQMLRAPVWRHSSALTAWGWILFSLGIFITLIFAATSSPDPSYHGPQWLPVALAIAMFPGPLIGAGALMAIAGHRRRRRFDAAAPVRAMALRLWRVARYCHRDHCVYLPDGRWAPASNTRAFLVEAARQAVNPAGDIVR